ncbi:MAG TPA: RNA polymerase sigma factor [Ktedonobacteraceae bacterium]|nr:RNA polymerase sigma factor [Ktedonobacteraceae bacterium]
MNHEENELPRLLAADLKQHFRRLVLQYQDYLYTFMFHLTANKQEAEDIVQEALLGTYVTLAHYPPERVQALKLRPWLYKVALNVFRNRKRGIRPNIMSLDQVESDDLQTLEADQPDNIYELMERSQELKEHLSTLPEHYRIIVICYFFEELTYQEIADLLDQPIGTVKSRLHRGIQLLRQQMRKAQGAESSSSRGLD